MRLGNKRHICIKNATLSRRKISGGLLILFLIFLLFGSSVYFLKIIRPLMMELAKNEVTILAELSIHRVVGQLFQDTDFSEIVTISRLSDGSVGSVESNMSRVNTLKSSAAIAITDAIVSINETELSIPLGTLTGYDILAGIGPRLPVRLMPYGNVVVDFKTEFTETGINQTLLAVNLTAKANVGIVMPSVNMTGSITTDIPITQTVIVGKIPDNYVNIGKLGENSESDILDIIG